MSTTSNASLIQEFCEGVVADAAQEIARDTMGIRTLERQCSDAKDFHEVAVWVLEKALQEAFMRGAATAEQAAEEHAEHMAEAAAATRPAQTQPTPDQWLLMEDNGNGAGWRMAFDTHAEAMEEAEERAEKNAERGATDTVVWVQPTFGFFPTL